MEKSKKPSGQTLAKIIAPALILVAIVGVYFVKNAQQPEEVAVQEIPLHLTSVSMEEITARGLPTIIDFGADECVPCKEMAPVLVKLNEEMQGKASIHFVDVWKNPDASADFPIRVIPTQVFFMPDGSPYVPSEDILPNSKLGGGFQMYTHKDTGEHLFTTHEGGLTEEILLRILEDMGVSI